MTLDQFEQLFADFLATYAQDPDAFEENWPLLDVRYICDTPTCHQAVDWIEFQASFPVDGVWKIWCGPCSKPIYQIDPMFSDDPDYRMNIYVDDGNGNPIPWGS